MTLTALESIVVIFSIIGIVKILVILIDREQWIPIVEKIYSNPKITFVVYLIVALGVFYLLLQEMNLVQIIAVMIFSSLFIGLGFLSLNKEMLKLSKSIIKKGISPLMWVYSLIWLLLLAWVLYEIFVI